MEPHSEIYHLLPVCTRGPSLLWIRRRMGLDSHSGFIWILPQESAALLVLSFDLPTFRLMMVAFTTSSPSHSLQLQWSDGLSITYLFLQKCLWRRHCGYCSFQVLDFAFIPCLLHLWLYFMDQPSFFFLNKRHSLIIFRIFALCSICVIIHLLSLSGSLLFFF